MKKCSSILGSYRYRITALFLAVFLGLMLPLYYIARYNVPSADDFVYERSIKVLIEESINPLHWFTGLAQEVSYAWSTAQGTYGSHIVSRLWPMEQSTDSYFMVPIVLLTAFCVGMYWMLKQILYYFQTKRCNVIILATILCTMCIQLVPSVVEAFYWRSGALLYTGFFALAMLALGWLFYVLREKPQIKKIWQYTFLAVLMLLVEGGGYPVALGFVLVVGAVLLYVFLEHRDRLPLVLLFFCVCLLGLLLNVLAPGNTARLERLSDMGIGYQGTVWRTIVLSFWLGFQFIREWCSIPLLLGMIVAVPVLYDGLRNSTRQFRWPLLFSVATLCVYCATYAPTAYTYGWVGSPRYLDINFYAFILLIFANEAYYIGWLCARLRDSDVLCEAEKVLYVGLIKQLKKYTWGALIVALLIIVICLQPNFYTNDTIPQERPAFATESAIDSLKNGEARQYYHEYQMRMLILMDDKVNNAILEPYSCKPKTLYFDDIVEDSTDWRNRAMADWFEKGSVALKS